jgi:homoserine dehydrogenase
VLRLLHDNREAFAERVGAPLEVVHVLVRDKAKRRGSECRAEWITDDPERVLGDESVDLVLEVIGGEQPAKSFIERALKAKKSVVTANKLLIAKHGPELIRLAVDNRVDLAFEASVGGGIPVIRTLRDALASDRVESVHGILNGTCNYILTQMRSRGLSFEVALKQAQDLGYAEAEPSLDVDGHDAAQKLVVTSMLAFDAEVDAKEVPVEGIRAIDQLDFDFAERFGYTIKHLAIGREREGKLSLRAHPTLVPQNSVLANINDVLNAVYVIGRALGPCLLVGRGAGDMPTAVSVVADTVDVACARYEGEPGLATRAIKLIKKPLESIDELESRYYLRFDVVDSPGVLGAIATQLGKHEVSIEHMVQEGRAADENKGVPVLIITHRCREGRLQSALGAVASESFMRSPPRLIRIEPV